MADDYDNVGSGVAAPPASAAPEVRLKIHHGDPSFAAPERPAVPPPVSPELPVSIPEPAPVVPVPAPPAPQPPGSMFATLHNDVAPFRMPEPRVPATEYVSIAPQPLPRPVPRPVARPRPQPAPPKAVPLPTMNGQAIGPIIRKRPQGPEKVVQPSPRPPEPPKLPVPPPQPVQTPKPAPAPMPKSVPAPTPPPVIAEPPSTQPAMPPEPSIPPQPLVQEAPALAVASVAASTKPITIFSNNTRTVWHIRRSGKVMYSVAAAGILLVLIGVFVYWKSLGSPTNIQDIPLLNLH